MKTRTRRWALTVLAIALVFLMMPLAALAQADPTPPHFALPVGSDYVLATLIVGFLMSPIISFLSRSGWASHARAIASFAWCFIASLILLVAGNQLHWVRGDVRSFFGTFLVVFVMAIGLYKFYFQPSGIGPAIERATG